MSAATVSYYTAYVEIYELKRRLRIIIIIITIVIIIIIITYHHLHFYHHLISRLVIRLSMLVIPQNEWWLRSTRESGR